VLKSALINAKKTTTTWKKYNAKNFVQFKSVNDIKTSLVNEGPVETGFDVYDDFMNYKGGIYEKKIR